MRIVVDSSGDLFHYENLDFRSVPMKIITAEKEFVDDEKMDVEELVHVLRTTTERTTTSCPNAYDFRQAYEGADEIIVITITSSLSGSYNAAVQAAEQYKDEHPDCKIHVFDSLSTGPEMRLLVEKIAELLKENRTWEEVVAYIQEYMKHTHLIFVLESAQNLARNGRLSPALAKITEVLGIRFIGKASDQGTLQQQTIAKGAKRTITKIFEEIQKMDFNGGKIRITHILNPEAAQALQEKILSVYPQADVSYAPCTGLCSYYAEYHGLLIGVEDKYAC